VRGGSSRCAPAGPGKSVEIANRRAALGAQVVRSNVCWLANVHFIAFRALTGVPNGHMPRFDFASCLDVGLVTSSASLDRRSLKPTFGEQF